MKLKDFMKIHMCMMMALHERMERRDGLQNRVDVELMKRRIICEIVFLYSSLVYKHCT